MASRKREPRGNGPILIQGIVTGKVQSYNQPDLNLRGGLGSQRPTELRVANPKILKSQLLNQWGATNKLSEPILLQFTGIDHNVPLVEDSTMVSTDSTLVLVLSVRRRST